MARVFIPLCLVRAGPAARIRLHVSDRPPRSRRHLRTLLAAVTLARVRACLIIPIAAMRPQLTKGRAASRQVLEEAQKILTPEQWAKVPKRIRAPGAVQLCEPTAVALPRGVKAQVLPRVTET